MFRLVFAIVPIITLVGASNVCAQELFVPDPKLTPGLARSDLTVEEICTTTWGSDARHVSAEMKRQVFAEYGLSGNDDPACVSLTPRRRCEIDHLIPRELGGADDIRNLWPEPYEAGPWNATRKDRLETRLRKEVCAHRLALEEAQHEIATDWRVPFVRYFGEPQ